MGATRVHAGASHVADNLRSRRSNLLAAAVAVDHAALWAVGETDEDVRVVGGHRGVPPERASPISAGHMNRSGGRGKQGDADDAGDAESRVSSEWELFFSRERIIGPTQWTRSPCPWLVAL